MTERWFNYRPLCLIFLFLIAGSLLSYYFLSNIAISITISIIAISVLIFVAIKTKNWLYIVLPIVALIVGIGMYQITVNRFKAHDVGEIEVVQARISSITSKSNGRKTLYVTDVIFDGSKQNSNAIVYVYDNTNEFENTSVGDVVSFKPKNIYTIDLFYNKTPNASYVKNNIHYSITVNSEDISLLGERVEFKTKVKNKIYENLHFGLSSENADLAYAAMFGDKSHLGDNTYDAYKLSGVAHLLAVSGLHVSIISIVLYFIFGKVRFKNWLRFLIISVMLMFYAYLCNFSVSVMRAVIMFMIFMLASVLGREYDSLSSMSLAGIILFLINPLCIFDVSFLLSFACCIGIIMFYKPFSAIFKKFIPSKMVAESISISLAVTITIMAISAFYFGTINFVSLLSNLILIPLFTIGFSVAFVMSFLSLLISKITIILYPINYLFDFMKILAIILGSLPFATVVTKEIGYMLIVLYLILLIILSRLCIAKHRNKIIFSLPLVALLLVCLI